MKSVSLKKSGRQRVNSGHPWLRADDFQDRTGLPKRAGAFFHSQHWWLYSPESYLRLRRLGPAQKNWMQNSAFNYIGNADQFNSYFGPWLKTYLTELLRKKMAVLKLEKDLCLRWVFSENDGLPGLIVDIFGDTLTCQLNSAPVELFWFRIKEILKLSFQEVSGIEPNIIELRNNSVRLKEGLEVVATEVVTAAKKLHWNGFLWEMSPGSAQKTGAYFDQKENHLLAVEYAKKYKAHTAWDLCCYQGGFALHLLAAGLQVTALDQSAGALSVAKKNVQQNSLPMSHIEFVEADIFAWLHDKHAKEFADFIILDPPSFVKNRQNIAPALKGLKELNTLTLKHLKPGGILFTCVCSHHISEKDFKSVLQSSARESESEIQFLDRHGPSPDHTPLSDFPEGRYLQCWVIRKAE